MNRSKLIIVNTLATYGQSLIGMFLSLFSTRWILLALGESDFGLFGVVGSLILMLTFLNDGLIVGVTRFYAYAVGYGQSLTPEESIQNQKRWFNAALSIYLVLPLIIVAIGLMVGEQAIRHWLTIPANRIESCIVVLRISMVAAFFSIISVPFTAMFNAQQHISELAIYNILSNCLITLGAWCLLHASNDRLVIYATYMTTISSCFSIVQIIRAVQKFPACRISKSLLFDSSYIRQLFGFVSWKILGMTCVAIRTQGIPIITNLFFGPAVNAAYHVANRLCTQATTLSTAMSGAFQPAIVSAEGQGDRKRAISMSMKVCKYGGLLVLLFVIPLTLEVQGLLAMWLKYPPKYAAELCQCMLILVVIDRITAGPMIMVNAHGKIANYEIVQGFLLFTAVPLAWLMLRMDMGPMSIGYSLVLSTTLYCGCRLAFASAITDFPVSLWCKSVCIPIAIIVLISSCAGWFIHACLDAGLIRLILVCVATALLSSSISWLLVLDNDEREFTRMSIINTYKKIVAMNEFRKL